MSSLENTIHKYPLVFAPHQVISMPLDAQVIHVALQRGVITLWAIVNQTHLYGMRSFHILPTGQGLFDASSLKHLGSVVDQGHDLVWHVFELSAKEVPTPPPDTDGVVKKGL